MIFKKNALFFLAIIIPILFTEISYAQDVDNSDLIVHQTTSSKYHDIVLQSHKGLPRFGSLNNYLIPVKNNNGYKKKYSSIRQDPATREKNKKIQLGYQNYFKMVTFKYLSDIYKDMDRERLTKISSQNQTKKQENSIAAQGNLRGMLTICAEEKCKNGFSGKNEFERLRNYKTFVNENLDDLTKWSNVFFKNNNVVGYYVSILGLGSYDFDKNGYWTYLSFQGKIRSSIQSPFFEPKASYENNILNINSRPKRGTMLQILLPIPPEKAEKLQQNNIKSLYLVKKIKLKYKKTNIVGNNISQYFNFSYHHESPVLEIYEDMALTKKIGTLSLDNLIIKKQ